MMALYEVDEFDNVLAAIGRFDNLFVMTRAEKGSVIVKGNTKIVQDAMVVKKIIDTTGAGDAYTAAFLYGWICGKTLDECARLGTHIATSVIQQIGARIDKDVFSSYQ